MLGRRSIALLLAFAALLATVFAASAVAKTINGTAKNDVLRGTSAADRIYGKGGNDKLYGLGGNDVLNGGPGNDTITGGPGADRIVCGSGKDTVSADAADKVARDCEVVRGLKPVAQPANILPGRYCGFTSQGMSICFTVSSNRLTFTEGHFGVRFDCEPDSTHQWTIDFPDRTAINSDGSFEYRVDRSDIEGMIGSYVRGTIDAAGSSQGTLHLTSLSFSESGTAYRCETADATWTAKKQQ